jgi:hypothetical protein
MRGALDVPTNTRIWTIWSSNFALFGPDGPVELEVTEFGDGLVHTPKTPLQPLTAYRYAFENGFPQPDIAFTTGPGPDLAAPSLPRVLGWTAAFTSEGRYPCRETDARVTLDVEAGDPDTLVVVLDRAGTSIFNTATIDGDVSAVIQVYPDTSSHTMEVGAGECLDNWPGAKRGAETTVRLGAFDLAGNFSGWSEPEEVRIEGCNIGANAGSPLAVFVPVLLVRRRRPHRYQSAPPPSATCSRSSSAASRTPSGSRPLLGSSSSHSVS